MLFSISLDVINMLINPDRSFFKTLKIQLTREQRLFVVTNYLRTRSFTGSATLWSFTGSATLWTTSSKKWRTFPLRAHVHVPFFHISDYSITITLVSAPSSYFIYPYCSHARDIYCVGYTSRAWDPRSLESILDVPLVFRSFATSSLRI